MTKESSQMTTNSSQDIAELHAQIEALGQELQQKVTECDNLRTDIAGLLAELTEERRQRIESNALLLATARARGLDVGDMGDLPQKAAEFVAEGSAVCLEWSEKCQALEAALKQIETDGVEHWDSCPFCLAHWRDGQKHEHDCPYFALEAANEC